MDWQDDADRKEETLAIIADLLGFSWTGKIEYILSHSLFFLNKICFDHANIYVKHLNVYCYYFVSNSTLNITFILCCL